MVKSKIVAIIQARVGSTRLPNKVLKEIINRPLIWHIINRLKSVNRIDDVIIATSKLPENDILFKFSQKNDLFCYRGSENDVLSRFYEASRSVNAAHIIRITADCPLVDPGVINELIEKYMKNSYDFCGVACGAGVSNEKNILRYPDGLDAEIFSFRALENAFENAVDPLHREHVTPFIWKNKNKFNIGTLFPMDKDFSSFRFTIDNKEDFEMISSIYNQLFSKKKNVYIQRCN